MVDSTQVVLATRWMPWPLALSSVANRRRVTDVTVMPERPETSNIRYARYVGSVDVPADSRVRRDATEP